MPALATRPNIRQEVEATAADLADDATAVDAPAALCRTSLRPDDSESNAFLAGSCPAIRKLTDSVYCLPVAIVLNPYNKKIHRLYKNGGFVNHSGQASRRNGVIIFLQGYGVAFVVEKRQLDQLRRRIPREAGLYGEGRDGANLRLPRPFLRKRGAVGIKQAAEQCADGLLIVRQGFYLLWPAAFVKSMHPAP